MRVLHVLDHSPPLQSGYVYRTAAIVSEQNARGWQTVQLTSNKHGPATQETELVDGTAYHRTLPTGGAWSRLPVLREVATITSLTRRIQEVVARERPDILHAHSPCLNGLAALRAGRRCGIPVVYELRASWEDAAVDHGTTREGSARYRASRALETYVLRKVDAIVTLCEGLRGDIVSRGLEGSRITVVPNGVDLSRFRTAGAPDVNLRRELGLGNETVIGFIGSFYAYEGIELLLDALPAILARHPAVRVLLVGGGYQEERLRRSSARPQLRGRVIMTGRVPHAEVDRYYSLVDVLVYPRRSMRLTELVTPLKPLEAMAQGKLVVASDVGGMRELVEDGVTGSLFRAGDAASLAETVCALLDQRESWPERRRKAREFVERERDWRSIVAGYEDVYASVLRAAPNPQRARCAS